MAENSPVDAKAQEKIPGFGILAKIMGKEKGEKPLQAEAQETKDFIPELKTDGKAKAKELEVESPLDAKANEQGPQVAENTGKKENAEEEGGDRKEIKEALDGGEFLSHTNSLLQGDAHENQDAGQKANSKVTLVMMPNEDYSRGISILTKKMGYDYEKIAYVALNETVSEIEARFAEERVDKKKFVVIDALTMSESKSGAGKKPGCIFVASPNALIELSLAITQAINDEKAKAMLFDSVSTLLVYENDKTISRFAHSVIGKIRASGVDAYFTALEDDSKKEAIKDLSLFVDKTIQLEDFVAEQFPGMGIEPKRRRQREYIGDEAFRGPSQSRNYGEPAVFMAELEGLRRKIDDSQKNSRIRSSMEELKEKLSRLEDMREKINRLEGLTESEKERYRDMSASLDDVKDKLKKLEGISKLEDEVREIYRKIEEIDEKSQLSMELKKSLDSKKEAELRESIEEMKSKLKKLEGVASLEEEVKALNRLMRDTEEKLQKGTREEIESQAESMREFSKQLDELSKRISDSQKNDKTEEMSEKFSKELAAIKSEVEAAAKKDLEARETESGEKERLKQALDEVKSKLAGLEKIGQMEQQIMELQKKIEEHDERSQLSSELKKSIETQKSNELKQAIDELRQKLGWLESNGAIKEMVDEMKKNLSTLEELKEKMKKLEEIPSIENDVKDVSKRISEAEERIKSAAASSKTVDEAAIRDFSRQVDTLRQKIEELQSAERIKQQSEKNEMDERSKKYNEGIAVFGKQIEELSKKEEETVSAFSKQIDALRQKLDEAHAANLEKDSMDRKLMEHISAMETHISGLEKRLEATELEKALLESESEARKISEEKYEIERALKKISDEGYRQERLASLGSQLEKISAIESSIQEKRKSMQEKLDRLASEKS